MTAISQITAWLLLAIEAWSAVPRQPHADEIHERVAEAIVAIAYDETEPPVYQGDYGRARTALLLASIAGEETRYAENVLTGHCKAYQCDHGRATSAWQIHTGVFGVRFIGSKYAQCLVAAADCYLANELIDDWELASRVAVHVYRTRPSLFTTVLKAQAQANAWFLGHPAPVKDADIDTARDAAEPAP